jgi:beta-N-acetylhexosaminidase
MDSEQILSLPLKKKIGQLFFIGLPGAEVDEATSRLLEDISPGGVCLFARNIREAAQTRSLTDNIRGLLPLEPFLSIDQEGGLVDRLRRVLTPMPAASSLKTPADAEKLAGIISDALRTLGLNMDFAPVVDVIDDSRSRPDNGLYSRAYGKSAEDVAEFAGAFLDGLQTNGCSSCLKHFPGLGASEVDSHEELPAVAMTDMELEATDLRPYEALIKTRAPAAVMVAHACFPNSNLQETGQNGKLLPSSLSFNFVTTLLRERLGFDGLVITDDLEMGAILKNYGIGDACKMAILAGNDMLAICADSDNVREGFTKVLAAVEAGEISIERIDESMRRIAAARSRLTAPLEFTKDRIQELSGRIAELNRDLN